MNDVLLAAISGALRNYMQKQGISNPPDIKVRATISYLVSSTFQLGGREESDRSLGESEQKKRKNERANERTKRGRKKQDPAE